MTIRRRHLLVAVIVLPLAGLVFAWSGLISVRASSGHWGITNWFLHWVMKNSVRTAAFSIEAPPLDEPGLLPAAAGHYETGCAICHGSPAQARSDAVLAMLPSPPDLKVVIPAWSDEELFEIVKHGVRYTGMPAWPTQVRDDEVWAMVAFLRKLPELDTNAYLRVSGLHGIGHAGEVSPLPITCESCHAESRLDETSVIPRLAGQSEPYLLNSLRAYARGERASGIMQVAVGTLADESLPELARYYANQSPGGSGSAPADPLLVERGRELAERGRPSDRVPACLSCHEKLGGNPAYPRLSGQTAAYLERQLRLFHGGVRGGSPFSHLMVEASKHLQEGDFAALAVFFASRHRAQP